METGVKKEEVSLAELSPKELLEFREKSVQEVPITQDSDIKTTKEDLQTENTYLGANQYNNLSTWQLEAHGWLS